MDAVREDVELLVQKELETANKKFSMFRSRHEGCAVIAEEIQEAEFEFEIINEAFETIWNLTKNDECGEVEVYKVKNSAISMAVEAIQVAAMAQKFVDSEKQRTEKENADKITG